MTSYLVARLRTTAIENMLDTVPDTAHKAIVVDRAIPESLQELRNLLQIYIVSEIGPHDIDLPLYNVNCRQATQQNAEALGKLVYATLNRLIYGNKYTKCTIQPCIFEEDNRYNVPVEIRIYSRG
jgi:hypothetical protein